MSIESSPTSEELWADFEAAEAAALVFKRAVLRAQAETNEEMRHPGRFVLRYGEWFVSYFGYDKSNHRVAQQAYRLGFLLGQKPYDSATKHLVGVPSNAFLCADTCGTQRTRNDYATLAALTVPSELAYLTDVVLDVITTTESERNLARHVIAITVDRIMQLESG